MSLQHDALTIWHAGVQAVAAERLVKNVLRPGSGSVFVHDEEIRFARMVVVGAGKAGAGMAAAVEEVAAQAGVSDRLEGWVNVPADCVRPLPRIRLHPGRPAGVNEPTAAGVEGSGEILRLVRSLSRDDLCLVLLSGGGSALLPAPVEGISLEDKQAVTRHLMRSGAAIHELNTVRKQLSNIKGGGLARAMTDAGRMIALIISDVVGDPLDVIASGPTVPDSSTAGDALAILERFGARPPEVPQSVFDCLRQRTGGGSRPELPRRVENHIVGNNQTAIDAAAAKARSLGYRVQSLGSAMQGEANTVGRELLSLCQQIRDQGQPIGPPACVLSGGEPVVHLVPTDKPRKGGRNQQLVLAAADSSWATGLERIVLLSGGTDGEDGPTDAAGAWVDGDILRSAREKGISPAEDLAFQNAYHFFETAGGLLKTGPTHTNVMDLRVGLIG